MCLLSRKTLMLMMVSSSIGLVGIREARAETANVHPASEPAAVPPSEANAGNSSPTLERIDSNYHAHRGFYVGLKVGGGYRSFTGSDYEDVPVDGWSATGGGVGINLSIGGALVENLVLHGDLVSSLASNPTLTVGDSGAVETEGVTARLIGFGAGVTYFIMPLNVYVEGTLLASSINIDRDGEPLGNTGMGIGGIVQAGKQFWISRQWAIDVGPSFHVATMRDKTGDGRVVGWAASLLAGVSYN